MAAISDVAPLRLLAGMAAICAVAACRGGDRGSDLPAARAASPDLSRRNAEVVKNARYDVVYVCSAELESPRLGRILFIRTLGPNGALADIHAEWDKIGDYAAMRDNRSGIAGVRLRGIWNSPPAQDFDIDAGFFDASLDLYPPLGSAKDRPAVYFVDGGGRRLALPSTWPEKFNEPRQVSAALKWTDIMAAARRSGDLMLVAASSSQRRGYPIEQGELARVEGLIQRLRAKTGDDARDFRRRCRAEEQVPMD